MNIDVFPSSSSNESDYDFEDTRHDSNDSSNQKKQVISFAWQTIPLPIWYWFWSLNILINNVLYTVHY